MQNIPKAILPAPRSVKSNVLSLLTLSKALRFPFGALLWLVASCGLAQSPPSLSVQVSNELVRLRITGDVGSACVVQWATNLYSTNNWQFLTNLTPLSSSPCLVADTNAVTAPRFYRAFAQQVPTNVVTTNMVWIPSGTFTMGSPTSEAQRSSSETQHTVTLTKGFYIGKYAVTQGEYLALMGSNPSYFTTRDFFGQTIPADLNRPVEQVGWVDATNYCTHLTQQEQAAGRLPVGWAYRLPTESEREYACRAGTTTAFNFGSGIHGGMASFFDSYEYDASVGEISVSNPAVAWLPRTTAVGSYQPNAWGLYDMHGNVSEWCRDLFGTYPTGSVTDPQGGASGSIHVIRGGCFYTHGAYCRSAYRDFGSLSLKNNGIGFRVVLAPGQP
jgi:formylglycine-generating enzyme required for sulfatase activity